MADLQVGGAGWQQEDADWERWQRAGREALAAGDQRLAGESFARALRIARQGFQEGDPRLASSLASHASSLSRRGDPLASRLFEEALRHWDRVGSWLDRQELPRLARSSLFHLRLEAKHPGAYASSVAERCRSLAEAGRAATRELADSRVRSCITAKPDWQPNCHDGFDVLRKVTSAVRLIADR